jgi:hypothetical protein
MKRKLLYLPLAFLFTGILFQQCKKDEEKENEDLTYSQNTTSQTNNANNEFEDVGRIADEAINTEDASNMRVAAADHCWDTLIHDKTSHLITVKYNGSTCSDGRIRKGNILIDYVPGKSYIETGYQCTITLQNYSVNGIKVEGTRKIENLGPNSANNLVHKITEANGKVTYTDNSTITWASTRTREWKNFLNTPFNFTDDEWIISGTANGIKQDGKAYSINFDKITYKMPCLILNIAYPSSGLETITVPEGALKVNFGQGNCDKEVVITYFNGKDYAYTLK